VYWSTYVRRDGGSPPSPRQTLFINHYSKPRESGAAWELGTAPVNYYNSVMHCSINLNSAALGPDSDYPDSTDIVRWSGVVIHEMMHNYGWQHGTYSDADYGKAWMIAYERCYTGEISLNLTGQATWRCGRS